MKTNKRIARKQTYQRYSAFTGKEENNSLKTGKGWNLASDVLGAATAFFSGGWKRPYEPATTTQPVTPAKNNTPLYIGLAIVAVLIIAVVITRKK